MRGLLSLSIPTLSALALLGLIEAAPPSSGDPRGPSPAPRNAPSLPPGEWTNSEPILDPQRGPTFPGMMPGIGGYKIFGPGAIRKIPVRPVSSPIDPQALYRSGYTDAWIHWEPPGFGHYGSHTSDSDLFEQEIWVDGYLRPLSSTGWWATCSDHRVGQRATCLTYFWYPVFCRNIYAESLHHFHTDGFEDDNFKTGDISWDGACMN